MSKWAAILSPSELEAYHARTATIDPRFAREQREFYQSRTPVQLRVLAAQSWLCNDADGYQLAMSYAANGKEEGAMARYIPKFRPCSTFALPPGVSWNYVEAPAMYGLANRPDLPQSRHRYGIVELSRELTADEAHHFDLQPAGEG